MKACFPPAEEGLSFHLRLLDMAPDAAADLCRAYLEPLVHWLGGYAPSADPDLCQTAAEDALLSYLNNPSRYDPHRAGLTTFLQMAARRDLWNLQRRQKRCDRNHTPLSVVEDGQEGGNLLGREEEPIVHLQRQEEAEQMQTILASIKANCTAAEWRVLELMLAGERRDAVFAEALDVGDRPDEEQAREVKRVKDRLKKRLEREGRKYA
jgi:RNA polymerase sigma-70 factor (ECF subfamily)